MMPEGNDVHRRLRNLLVVATLALLGAGVAPGQGSFTFAIRGYDGVTPVPGQDTVFIGRDPRATYCIDPYTFYYRTVAFQEYELPPPPPTGVFDMRSRQFRSGSGGCTGGGDWTQGMRFDVRGSVSRAQIDTFQVLFQVGASPMSFSWETGLNAFCDSMKMQDSFGGILLNVNMFTTQTVSLTGALTGLDRVAVYLYGAPALSLVSPANGSTVPQSLTLTWSARAGATLYHLQVATDSLFTTGFVVNDSSITGTSSPVSGLSAPVTYYWRVSAGNALGFATYSPTWHFTTQLQLPPAPTLLSPSNGQTNTPTTLPLQWNPVGGADTYRLQVATDSTFASGIVVDDSTLTATSDTVGPLQNGTRYFWHVRAKNTLGSGPYSATWNFTTLLTPPPAPVLQSPPDGAVNVSLIPTLTWSAALTASSYRLQVALDSLFVTVVVDDSTITGTSRQIGQLLSNTTHYWHVRGKNTGGSGPYSARFHFTTTQAPPAPFLVSPPDSALRLSATPTFVWRQVAGATSYNLQIATEPTFASPIVNDSTITDTVKTVPPLPFGTALRWRVRARNASGSGDFSTIRMFTVMLEPPGMPVQVAPANNLLDAPVTIPIRWNRTPLAAGYELQIALDTLMTTLFRDTTVVDTVVIVNVLPSRAHYWRLRAFNIENTYGPWTAIRRFTTGNFPPAIPTPLHPMNGDTGLARNTCFSWTESPGALTYRVQVSTNIAFPQGSILFDDSTLTTTPFCPGLLPARMSCFWRVRSKGTAGSSNYSQVQAFTTSNVVPVEEEPEARIPSEFVLRQNYPNPFNPSTAIPFEISEGAFVTLKVYDVLGREIQTLMNQDLPVGAYTVRWNGQNDSGAPVPSGMYFVRMTAVGRDRAGNFAATRKIVLLK